MRTFNLVLSLVLCAEVTLVSGYQPGEHNDTDLARFPGPDEIALAIAAHDAVDCYLDKLIARRPWHANDYRDLQAMNGRLNRPWVLLNRARLATSGTWVYSPRAYWLSELRDCLGLEAFAAARMPDPPALLWVLPERD